MYNLRYHIASLVAVFLALAVGLLLGSVVAERGMITEQASSLVEDLERRFDEITATNDQLSVGLDRDRAFAEAAVAPLIEGSLAGTDVLVFVGTGRVDGMNAVTEAVTQAGGSVTTMSVLTPGLGLAESEPEGLAGYFQLRGVEMAEAGEALQEQVARALLDELRTGQTRELADLLVARGLLTADSEAGTATVDAIVIVGNGQDGYDPFSIEVATALSEAGGIAVSADSASVEGGVVAASAARGMSAVDHVGTPQGRVSLVWLLAGRATGHFGFGDGAQAAYPPLGP